MIRSFKDSDTRALFERTSGTRFQGFERVARRKIAQLHAAAKLDDLRIPPGNRLEPLKGNRQGQHSIRINDQLRLCFVWNDGGADEVEITDYH